MMTQTTVEKINRRISNINEELRTFRSLIIGFLGQDREGEYRPEFVRKVLKLSKEKSDFVFKDAKFFLKQIRL